MMFMMPMPPTTRLTAATAASRPVSVRVAVESVSLICLASKMLKSSSALSGVWRRSRSSERIDALTAVVS